MELANRLEHHFRLVRADDERDGSDIEVDAGSADSALFISQQRFAGKECELFDQGISLGKIRYDPEVGCWNVSAKPRQRVD